MNIQVLKPSSIIGKTSYLQQFIPTTTRQHLHFFPCPLLQKGLDNLLTVQELYNCHSKRASKIYKVLEEHEHHTPYGLKINNDHAINKVGTNPVLQDTTDYMISQRTQCED